MQAAMNELAETPAKLAKLRLVNSPAQQLSLTI
jgi:hypothetical protein